MTALGRRGERRRGGLCGAGPGGLGVVYFSGQTQVGSAVLH